MKKTNLPEMCYAENPSSGKTIIIKRFEAGYYPCGVGFEDANADKLNKKLGVTKAQSEAMLAGSMFGWTCKGADPDSYDENGVLKRTAR